MRVANVTRRELLDIFSGATRRGVAVYGSASSIQVRKSGPSDFDVYWDDKSVDASMPIAVVVPEEALSSTLASIASIPSIPSPITAYCKFLTWQEVGQHYGGKQRPGTGAQLRACSLLALMEAIEHLGSDGMGRPPSLSSCRRTLSFAWGKALARSTSAEHMENLAARWIETVVMLSGERKLDHVRLVSLAGVLFETRQLDHGPRTRYGRLADAFLRKDLREREDAWSDLARDFFDGVTLASLAEQTREDRSIQLLRALKLIRQPDLQDELAPICAFLATQISPGSLEHLDIFRKLNVPGLLPWYGFFASVQPSRQVINVLGGIPLRLMRELEASMGDALAEPADISYAELRGVAHMSLDRLFASSRFSEELSVEISPGVSVGFSITSDRMAHSPKQDVLPGFETRRVEKSVASIARLRSLVSSLRREIDSLEAEALGESEVGRKRGN